MISMQNQKDALVEQFESKEAGVTELLELYARVEATYVNACQALTAEDPGMTSNAANPE